MNSNWHCEPKKHQMLLSHHQARPILIKFCTYCPNIFATEYYKCFPPHLNNAPTLPCETYNLWFFVEILMLEKRNSRNFAYWLWCYLLKKMQLLTFRPRYGKSNQENMYQTLSESALFCERYDKNILAFFRFTFLTAVHLQNVNAKFHNVG